MSWFNWFRRKPESAFVAYARRELEIAGLMNKDSDYDGELGKAILTMVKVFSGQGHSGMSASMAASALEKLLRYQPLTPLTGADDEWMEVGPEGLQQNCRCSGVFRQGGEAFYIDGIVWRDKDGCTFTNYESRVPVAFPYTPRTEIRGVKE